MIIGCPQCNVRFVVPSTIFMRGGRKLRCSSCKHTWFQEEPLEKSDEAQSFAQSLNATRVEQSQKESVGLIDVLKQDFSNGLKVIMGVFALTICGYFAYWYMTPSLVMGEGLAFDSIEIARDGASLSISGQIVNAISDNRGVPSLKITKLMEGDIKGDSIIVTLDKTILESGEILPFTHSMDNVGAEVVTLHIGFDVETPEATSE